MSGKVVLITGASSGLGELMAYEYAKRGAYLAIIAIKEPESRLEQVARTARELGSPDVLFMFADVSKVDDCRMFVDSTVKYFGRLDHLVCNAGIGAIYSIDIDVSKFEPVMDVNFWGSVYPTHFAIPHLVKTNGKIIVNSSSSGALSVPKAGVYGASKAALISFYESLRHEVSPTVTITIVTLGFIETDIITSKYFSNTVSVGLKRDVCIQRWGPMRALKRSWMEYAKEKRRLHSQGSSKPSSSSNIYSQKYIVSTSMFIFPGCMLNCKGMDDHHDNVKC
ncbi:hypothetical protein E3N88_31103 [Mikania micrantha]|uniref:Glucose/ribitol dehydrogenase n=1 Tax=Mikania micrantha TaxID=192012 RepID=A0A5N6MPD8_9ASTR|nr:hypothetical protein E3N88_31103 [Mikania micrantha]